MWIVELVSLLLYYKCQILKTAILFLILKKFKNKRQRLNVKIAKHLKNFRWCYHVYDMREISAM